jgi:hypothetical protein
LGTFPWSSSKDFPTPAEIISQLKNDFVMVLWIFNEECRNYFENSDFSFLIQGREENFKEKGSGKLFVEML